MARSPTARVELSKKTYLELINALLSLLAALQAAGKKAGFPDPEESDSDDAEDEDEAEEEEADEEEEEEEEADEEEEEEEEAPSKKKKKASKSDDEDEEDEEEEEEIVPLKSSDLKKVKAALEAVLEKLGRKDAVALLVKHKVEKVSDLVADQVAGFIKMADKLVASAPTKSKSKGKK